MTSKNYADPEWKRVRLQILARDGHRCQIAGPKCKGKATEVDHIVNVDDGGARLDPRNLRASCKSCNVSKRNREVAARARAHRNGTEAAPTPATGTPRRGVRTTEFGSWNPDGTWEPRSRLWTDDQPVVPGWQPPAGQG